MAHAQVAAAHTHYTLVHKAMAAEVGHIPAVIKHTVEGGDQVLGEGHQEHAPHTRPLIEIVGGVLDAAPLAADGGHIAGAVQAAQAPFTVDYAVNLVGRIQGHESLVFFLHALPVGLDFSELRLAEGLEVSLLEHVDDDGANFLQVLDLVAQLHIVLCLPEGRVGIFRTSCHYLLPSSL